MKLDELLRMRSMLHIVHHVPGRLRLKFDLAIRKHSAVLSHFSSLTKSLPDTGLRHVRLNAMARSLLLEYDPVRIAHADLQEFLETRDEGRIAELAPIMADMLGITLDPERSV